MSQIYNPYVCRCFQTNVNTSCNQSSSELTDCLKVCDAIVAAADSIGPCSELGSVLLADLVTLPKSTSGAVVYQIVEHSANLTNVTINSTSINYQSDWSNNQNESYRDAKIVWKVIDGIYSAIAELVIIFKPNGNELTCLASQQYNPCTGNCDAKSSDLEIGDGSTSSSQSSGTGFV